MNIVLEGGISFAQSNHEQRRVERYHRRLMNSLRTLAIPKRLNLPSIQVNIAKNQVIASG